MMRTFVYVLIFILCGSVLFSQENEMSMSEADGKWIVSHPDDRKIYTVQCGLDVTLFALKYFDIDYSLARVSSQLPLSEKGISLGHIQQVLELYGLNVSARQGATLREIAKRLNGDYIAIIPLGSGTGLNHYYVALMDNTGEVMLVNVPHGASALVSKTSKSYNEYHEKSFANAGGIVLFVSALSPLFNNQENYSKKLI